MYISSKSAANEPDDKQQNDCTDRRANDLAGDPSDGHIAGQKESSDNRAKNSNDYIPDEAKTSPGIKNSREPTGDCSYRQHDDNCNRIHGLPPFIIVSVVR
jgi:hypothetical protein